MTTAAKTRDRPFVASYLCGGLGNQLFQYAAGRSLASRTAANLILDASVFRNSGQARQFALRNLAIDTQIQGPVAMPGGGARDWGARPDEFGRQNSSTAPRP